MENDNLSPEYLEKIMNSLNNDELSTIDFDQLGRMLDNLSGQLDDQITAAQELSLIKDDYRKRIGGMVKAIAAVDRKRDALDQALAAISDLQEMSCQDLITCYQRTSARFRDCFPASFGPHNGAAKHWREDAPHK